MLSGILNSDKAINMNIAIMRAFVEIRKILLLQADLNEQLKQIREHLGGHDAQLNQIYDAMENLLVERAAQRKWEDRDRIGFKNKNESIPTHNGSIGCIGAIFPLTLQSLPA